MANPHRGLSRYRRAERQLAAEALERRHCLSGLAFASHDIVVTETDGPTSVFAADVDGDGDMDLLSASARDNQVAWHENIDGKGSFARPNVITSSAGQAQSVYAVDVDGDGDVDVLSASNRDNKIAWYENTDGRGRFGEQRLIASDARGAKSVYAADMDGDGDADVLSAATIDNTIAWYENDGEGNFGQPRVITRAAGWAVYATDVDGDGDMDVISASSETSTIAWHENTDGEGSFAERRVITTAARRARSVYAADLDADGDADVLSASLGDDKIAWYENTDGQGTFGQQAVITSSGGGALSVFAADLDGDDDLDVLSGGSESLFSDGIGAVNVVAWYENIDGKGTFGQQNVIASTAPGTSRWWDILVPVSVHAADLDGDGDMDVLSASQDDGRIAWYEQIALHAGDANGDFQFDQRDIIHVLTAARFLTGEPATFEQGDWNADGVFDQADLAAALQSGNYLQGPYALPAGHQAFAANSR